MFFLTFFFGVAIDCHLLCSLTSHKEMSLDKLFIVFRFHALWFSCVRVAPEKSSKRLVPPPKLPLSYLAQELQGWQGSYSSLDSKSQMVDYNVCGKNPCGQCGPF